MSAAPFQDLRRCVAEVEGLLAERARLRAQRPGGDADDLPRRRLERAIADLEQAAAEAPAPTGRLHARLREVRARYALHARQIPDDALDGLYEDVRAGAAEDRWGRAGMSGAFLDAPRALARWRWTATAACLLVAVGLGLLSGPESARDGRGPRPLADPRDDLLVPLDAPSHASPSPGPVQPAGFGGGTFAPRGRPSLGRAPLGLRARTVSRVGAGAHPAMSSSRWARALASTSIACSTPSSSACASSPCGPGPARTGSRTDVVRHALPALLTLLLAAVVQAGEEAPAKAAARAKAGTQDPPAPAATARDLELAARTRPSVARVRWRDARFGDLTAVRNAVVVRRDGLLVMAGPPPGPRGTLTVRFADGLELRAHSVASDAETALTLLRVPTTGLVPVQLAASVPTRDLALPALASRIVMVAGDGAVAVGAVRSHGRHGSLLDGSTRRRVRTTGLFGVALAAVDEDAGAPLLDDRGHVAGLLVGRRSAIAPERGTQASRPGLKVRPRPVEAVAVPASVVRLVWPLLERHGRVPRAGLGVETEAADATLRTHLGLETGGHLVRRLEPDGAAVRHGLALHDVIISIGGRTTPPETSLHDVLLPFRPRTQVRLVVIRAGVRLEIPVLLGERATGR